MADALPEGLGRGCGGRSCAMKVNGRYGLFTPRQNQAASYAKRAKREAEQRKARAVQLAAWLDKHKSCAAGCGKPVAFYDQIHYGLRFGGCCSAECERRIAQNEGGNSAG